jgi:hypothetical protein
MNYVLIRDSPNLCAGSGYNSERLDVSVDIRFFVLSLCDVRVLTNGLASPTHILGNGN